MLIKYCRYILTNFITNTTNHNFLWFLEIKKNLRTKYNYFNFINLRFLIVHHVQPIRTVPRYLSFRRARCNVQMYFVLTIFLFVFVYEDNSFHKKEKKRNINIFDVGCT